MRLPELESWCARLERRGWAVLRVDGTSMSPALRSGDVVTVEAEPLRPGDVAVLRTEEGLICHRQFWRGAGRILLKGDGQLAFQSLGVPRDARVVGRVASRLRGGGFEPLGCRWLGMAASIARIPIRVVFG